MAAVASSSRACAPAAWNAHELDLPSFAYAAHRDPLNARTLEAIGVTTRKCRRGALYRTLREYAIENPNGLVGHFVRHVRRWRNGRRMLVRWIAAALRESTRNFRRLRGHRDLAALVRAAGSRDGGQQKGGRVGAVTRAAAHGRTGHPPGHLAKTYTAACTVPRAVAGKAQRFQRLALGVRHLKSAARKGVRVRIPVPALNLFG